MWTRWPEPYCNCRVLGRVSGSKLPGIIDLTACFLWENQSQFWSYADFGSSLWKFAWHFEAEKVLRIPPHSLRFILCLPIVQFSCWGTADGSFQATWMRGGSFWWPSDGRFWQDTNMRLVQKHDINEETREFTLNCWSEYNWNVMLLCCTQLDGADVYGWFLKSCRQSSIQWALAVLWKDFGSYATKTISMVAQIFDNENARFIHLSSNITGTIL